MSITEKVNEYINEKLFTEDKPVLFTDLIFNFKVGPSRAKGLMYSYYKQNTTTKFNCIIICISKSGEMRIIHDVNNIEDPSSLVDCFIYAFNPMDVFIPLSVAVNQHDCLTIRNPYKLQSPLIRSKTLEEQSTSEVIKAPVARSKTEPQRSEPANKQKVKAKEGGLRSTAILAKMRGERESKERERQEELKKRKKEQMQQQTKNQATRSAQLQELNNLFDEEEEAESEAAIEGTIEKEIDEEAITPERQKSEPIDKHALEELLDTTVEDSLIGNNNGQQETPETKADPDTSYVDEDGYIVTNRAATSTPPPPMSSKKRPLSASKPDSSTKKRPTKAKKTQGTLENFFKKR